MNIRSRFSFSSSARPRNEASDTLEAGITGYIWRHTKGQQIWILTVVVLSMIPYYMAFDLPKSIVNGPIQGDGFASPDATQTFLRIAFDLPFAGEVVVFNGLELQRLSMLFALSAVFLCLVIINGLFKFYINAYKGKLGERLLRRIRFTLIDYVLRFPPSAFKRLKGAEIASMVKDEVEPLGSFTGDAFVAPALLGGQALTALGFIFVQNVLLGLITSALVAVQIILIPRMRRRLLLLGRERQITARQLAGRVSEIVDSIGAIHSNDTSNFERAEIASRLGHIFRIRYDIYQWKFLVKFINNFLASLTPFLFYSVGGYLALTGRLDIGQLVAVIGAYKDLPGPLKELIDWDQNRQDVEIKYQQVVSQFAVAGMIAPELHEVSAASARGALEKPLAAINLSVVDEGGGQLLENVNLQLSPGETVALVGHVGSGSDTLTEAFARLVWPTYGRLQAGSRNLLDLPESVAGRSITYAGTDSSFFAGSVYDNLLYGLKNAPVTLGEAEAESAEKRWRQREAELTGNPFADPFGNWIDYSSLDVSGPDDLMPLIISVLDDVLLAKDMRDMALRSKIRRSDHPELADKVVELRSLLRNDLEQQQLTDLIIPFELNSYNSEATVIENLLFGNFRDDALKTSIIGQNGFLKNLLEERSLADDFVNMGIEIARNVISLFADLPPEHPFFRGLTLMSADDIPGYEALLHKFDNANAVITPEDRDMMMTLAFEYVEPQFRFGLLDANLMTSITELRHEFHRTMTNELSDEIELYDPTKFHEAGTLLDNIFFGRVSQKYRDGVEKINESLARLLDQLGMHQQFVSVGLKFDVGTNGRRLTVTQRQKLALARALIRPSEYYLLNRPLSALDAGTQESVLLAVLSRLRARRDPIGVVWALSDPAWARHFDRVAVFRAGVLVEDGPADTLTQGSGILQDTITA